MKRRMMGLVSMALIGAMVLPNAAFAEAADEGKVLNIQVWNEEFKSRITDHYPGYEAVDETHGKIGDVDVVWTITPSDDNAYQNNLDSILPGNVDAADDDKVDIFLIEADYALKYVDADANVAMTLADLGITEDDLSKQYTYTQDIVKDADGNIRASSWQACSAGLIYNREIAKAVLGSDDPATVQEAVKDWATYNETAAKATRWLRPSMIPIVYTPTTLPDRGYRMARLFWMTTSRHGLMTPRLP